MPRSLLKYKIGLAIIGIFTIGLLAVVVMQASNAKQDNQTYKKAEKIVAALNEYVDKHGVPASLSAANIKDVPSTVSYEKLSGGRYKLCETFKTDGNSLNATNLETQLLTAGLGGGTNSDNYSNDTDKEVSYLYLPYAYHKGKNCQTVKPYTYDQYYDNSDSSSSGASTEDCNVDANGNTTSDEVYFACIKKKYNTSGSTGTSTD